GVVDHAEACRRIVLGDDQRSMLSERLRDLEDLGGLCQRARLGRGQGEDADRRGVTRIDARLCESELDRDFVEAFIVLTTPVLDVARAVLHMMTGGMVRAISTGRHEGIKLGNQQIERLKRKYIDRPSKPAERFELLREQRKGRWGKGDQPGTPSEYRVTGLAL